MSGLEWGFGHRRIQELRSAGEDPSRGAPATLFEVTGPATHCLDIALELEKIALEDDYFNPLRSCIRTSTSTQA